MHIRFYSKKNRRFEVIELSLLHDGWYMKHECYKGAVEPSGYPHLCRCLQENYTVYPSAFTDALMELWEAAVDKGLPPDILQERLENFSDWIYQYNKTSSEKPVAGT